MEDKNPSDFDLVVKACFRLLEEDYAKNVDVKDNFIIVEISKKQMIYLRQYFGDDSLDGDLPNRYYLEKVLTLYAHDVPVDTILSYVDGDVEGYGVGVAN